MRLQGFRQINSKAPKATINVTKVAIYSCTNSSLSYFVISQKVGLRPHHQRTFCRHAQFEPSFQSHENRLDLHCANLRLIAATLITEIIRLYIMLNKLNSSRKFVNGFKERNLKQKFHHSINQVWETFFLQC